MRLWVIAVVLLVPAAGAVPVDLYMHLAGFQDMPINTQEPQGESWQDRGQVNHSGCADLGINGVTSQSRHTWYAYGSPGLVEYYVSEESPRIHQQRGLGTDLRIDPDLPPVLTWNLVATGPAEGAGAPAAVVPEVVVRVQVRASDDITYQHAAFDAGPLVAFGEVGPVTLHEWTDHPSITRHEVGDLVVYAFEVPLALHNTTISQTDGYNIRIDAMMDNPHCTQSAQGGYIMPDLVTAYQGHGLWNKLHVGIENPLVLEYLQLLLFGGGLVVHAGAVSPFGNHDVMPGEGLVINGPAPLPFELVPPRARYHEHGHPHLRTYEPSWIVNVTDAENGIYTVELTVNNRQGTANATASATFEIGDHGVRTCEPHGFATHCRVQHHDSVDVPAVPIVWIGAVLLLVRRMRR